MLVKRVQRYEKFLYPQHLFQKKSELVLNRDLLYQYYLVARDFHYIDTCRKSGGRNLVAVASHRVAVAHLALEVVDRQLGIKKGLAGRNSNVSRGRIGSDGQ